MGSLRKVICFCFKNGNWIIIKVTLILILFPICWISLFKSRIVWLFVEFVLLNSHKKISFKINYWIPGVKGRLSLIGSNGGLISAIFDFNFFKLRFAGMHLFSKAIITLVTAATPEAPSPWPILLFNRPICRGSFLSLQ